MTRDDITAEMSSDLDTILRSLEDLDAENAAGEIDSADYLRLRQRYLSLAARAMAGEEPHARPARPSKAPEADASISKVAQEAPHSHAIESGGATSEDLLPPGEPGVPVVSARNESRPSPGARLRARTARLFTRLRARRRKWLLVLGIACLAAGALALAASDSGLRLPGETPTGGVSLDSQQLIERSLAQAQVLADEGKDAEALKIYNAVLAKSPDQPVALLASGWLEREAGLQVHDKKLAASGRVEVAKSVKLDPGNYEGHLLLGIILAEDDHDPRAAAAQFRAFLSEHPARSVIDQARPFLVETFQAAHEPLPAGL